MTEIKRAVAWDTETCQIRPGRLAPEQVCLSYQEYKDGKAGEPKLVDRHDAGGLVWSWLVDRETLLVGQNVSYDVAVMMAHEPTLLDAFFRAYDQDRFTDTMLRQKLIYIALGKYKGWPNKQGEWTRPRFDLDGLAREHLGITLDKDTWRLRYGEFIDPVRRDKDLKPGEISIKNLLRQAGLDPEMSEVPLRDWPDSAREYPKQDAVATLGVFLSQEGAKEFITDQFRQTRYALWKHLCSVRGLKTNPVAVMKFKQATEEELELVQERLVESGLVRKNGTRDTNAAKERMVKVCAEQGLTVRQTKTGGIALDADACEMTDDDLLVDYATFTTLSAMLNKDVPMLMAGVTQPIHTRFDMAESGRTTSSSNKELGAGTGNLQNLRRGAKKKKDETEEEFKARKQRSGDIRQCFVPRPGYVFAQADYEQLELRTLAQACITLFGRSKLGEELNAGLDPHSTVASLQLNKPYDWVIANKKVYEVENARQTGKVANFGFPGGLGPGKLVLFARKTYGVNITEDRARDLKRIWLQAYPEMYDFFDYIGKLGGGVVKQLFSDRLRGGCSFCQACNTIFQGLGADASQNAGWLIAKACYTSVDSPLNKSRPVLYVHDEFVLETPEGPGAHDAAMELERLMVEGAKKFLPDMEVSAPPVLMSCYSKEAKAVYDKDNRLIPWSPS